MSFLTTTRLAVLTAGALALASCSSTKESVGIENVDDLVSRVERVHLEAELAKESVYSAILKMGPLFARSFDGDPAQAFQEFADATETCEVRANRMRLQVEPMRNAATEVFQRWTENLEQFSSPKMRERSANRLEATRARFAEVYETAEAAQVALDDLNGSLRDTVLFLGHDFNAQAVAEIEEDAFEIRDQARVIGERMDACMDACAEYVEKSALRGQVASGDPEAEQGE